MSMKSSMYLMATKNNFDEFYDAMHGVAEHYEKRARDLETQATAAGIRGRYDKALALDAKSDAYFAAAKSLKDALSKVKVK